MVLALGLGVLGSGYLGLSVLLVQGLEISML